MASGSYGSCDSAAAELRERVLAVVCERGPIPSRKLALAVGRRKADVQAALRDLHRAGLILGSTKGWTAAIVETDESPLGTAGNRVPVPGNRCHGLTAAALDAMTRPERVWALWAAISPTARERLWGDLFAEQRVNVIAVIFTAREERLLVTSSAAIDAWQRRADR